MYIFPPRLRDKSARPANLRSVGACAGRLLLLPSHTYVPVFYLATTRRRRQSAAMPGSNWSGILLRPWFWQSNHLPCCRPSSPIDGCYRPASFSWLFGYNSNWLAQCSCGFCYFFRSKLTDGPRSMTKTRAAHALPSAVSRCCLLFSLLALAPLRVCRPHCCAIFPGTCRVGCGNEEQPFHFFLTSVRRRGRLARHDDDRPPPKTRNEERRRRYRRKTDLPSREKGSKRTRNNSQGQPREEYGSLFLWNLHLYRFRKTGTSRIFCHTSRTDPHHSSNRQEQSPKPKAVNTNKKPG